MKASAKKLDKERARPRAVKSSGKQSAKQSEPAAEWVALSRLRLWPDNPRDNDGEPVERVMRSIKRFGWGAPILARKADGEIIAGHARFKAAQAMELERVPVRYLDISKREAHLLALADNRIAELTQWSEALGAVLADFKLEELELAGWSDADLNKFGTLFGEQDATELGEEAASADEARFDVFDLETVARVQAKCLLGMRYSDFALSVGDVMVELNRCAAGGRPRIGIADRWFPHRYDVKAGKSPMTPNESLASAEAIAGAARVSAEQGQHPLRAALLSVLLIYRGRQCARQFPIDVARDIFREYSVEHARVLDPCAGWGGRLLGWLCSLQAGNYVGFDASAQTFESFGRMIGDLNIRNAYIRHNAFEDVQLEPASFDFAFTSPPYFDVEQYSDDSEQSCIRYKTYEEWRDNFLASLICKTLEALKPGCAFVLNVSDAGKHAIADDAVRIAQSANALIESRGKVDVGGSSKGQMNSAGISEDLLVLRKQ
jgi:16S rRNA G966 N2-methylase RsmD